MTGTIEAKGDSLFVRTEYLKDSGETIVSLRRINGSNGRPVENAPVRYAGNDTWDGIGFTVAAETLPSEGFTIPAKKRRKK